MVHTELVYDFLYRVAGDIFKVAVAAVAVRIFAMFWTISWSYTFCIDRYMSIFFWFRTISHTNRVGRENIVLRHSVPPFSAEFWRQCVLIRGTQRFTSSPERRNENIKYFLQWESNPQLNHTIVSLRYDWTHVTHVLISFKIKQSIN